MTSYPSNDVLGSENLPADTAWLKAEVQAALDDPRPSVPHEDVMQRMRARIEELKAQSLKNCHESAVHV